LRSSSTLTSSEKGKEVSKWKTAEVVKWLEELDLAEVAEIAKKEGWDGRILVGLNRVREKERFDTDCQKLGLDKQTLRLKLNLELENLFG